MKNTLCVNFYFRKSLRKGADYGYLECCIIVDNQRTTFRLRQKIKTEVWNQCKNKKTQKGTSILLKQQIEALRFKIIKEYNRLSKHCRVISADQLRNNILGYDTKLDSINKVFTKLLIQKKQQVGLAITKKTYEARVARYKRLKEYILKTYGCHDIKIHRVDETFINGYEFFLQKEYNISTNYIKKYLIDLKSIVTYCFMNRIVNVNPFDDYKIKGEHTDKVRFLTANELKLFMQYEPTTTTQKYAKDFFIFCSFTGLDFSTASALTYDNIYMDGNGNYWVTTQRVKTHIPVKIKLLNIPLSIYLSYKESHELGLINRILPHFKLNHYNTVLNKLAKGCGITKHITSHMARHTFATTIANNNGMNMYGISKVLGHTSTNMTKIYAKLFESKILAEFERLNHKI